jgi:predicted nucleotide-binding protein
VTENEGKKLTSLINQVDELVRASVTSSSPEFTAWKMRVRRFLLRVFGEDSLELNEFDKESFTLHWYGINTPDSEFVEACARGLLRTKAVLQTYLEDVELSNSSEDDQLVSNTELSAKVFVVHGHDGEMRESVARLLEQQDIVPIVLMEQANGGKTIIEKFEEYSDVSAAICLFTPDDKMASNNGTEEKPQYRARQNVVLEAGYFIGRLGRSRVIFISSQEVEMPSDLSGMLYSYQGDWKISVLRDLKKMGFDIDSNRLLEDY